MECLVGSHSKIIYSPPPIGSLITIKHSGWYKNGILRHPYFWRIYNINQISQQEERKQYFWYNNENRLMVKIIFKIHVFFLNLIQYVGIKCKLDCWNK